MSPGTTRPRPRAHPRSRGENCARASDEFHATGSSPLTRGKRLGRRALLLLFGLIPAHAGKTCRGRSVGSRSRAHPRSRGENLAGSFHSLPIVGSSPLTRGKRHAALSINLHLGLIPAHAGKTALARHGPAYDRAHPRSRGENSDVGAPHQRARGSSPLTRGKRSGRLLMSSRRRAHPRSRGENVCAMASSRRARGSSPLTRGKPAEPHARGR